MKIADFMHDRLKPMRRWSLGEGWTFGAIKESELGEFSVIETEKLVAAKRAVEEAVKALPEQ